MKWFMTFLILLPFLFGCAGRTVRQSELSAKGKIQEWDATPAGDDWLVTIWYDIHNTGTLELTGYSVHVTIDVEGNKTVLADCWGPAETVDDYISKKIGKPIAPGETKRRVIALEIPYKPMRTVIELEKFE